MYKDVALLKNGFPGESVSNGSVIAVKTHEWGAGTRDLFTRAILLVRDPFDSILAEFNRRSGGHIGHASQKKCQPYTNPLYKSLELDMMYTVHLSHYCHSWDSFHQIEINVFIHNKLAAIV